jgi:hypothetical protein
LLEKRVVAVLAILGGCGAGVAQEQPQDATEAAGGNFLPAAQQDSVEKCWTDWLKSEGLSEGKNERADGSFLLVSKAISKRGSG